MIINYIIYFREYKYKIYKVLRKYGSFNYFKK